MGAVQAGERAVWDTGARLKVGRQGWRRVGLEVPEVGTQPGVQETVCAIADESPRDEVHGEQPGAASNY